MNSKAELCLAFILCFGTGCLQEETPEETYAGFDEVTAAGAIERGWIPEWLPERGLFNKRVIRGNGLRIISFTLAELSNCNNRTIPGHMKVDTFGTSDSARWL